MPELVERLTFAARAERYARAVVAGEIVAGKWVKASCQRQLDDLERSATDPAWPYEFDPEACGRVCHFLQCLPHIKGKWARAVIHEGRAVKPKILLEDWQVFAYGVPFGWVHRETRLRRFRWIYDEVARKNAKSTPCAGLALYLVGADREPGAEVYSLATKEKQARIVWDMARRMVLNDPEFRRPPPMGLGIGTTRRAIFQDHSASSYEPLGRDSDTQDGLNTHAFVADELHAWKDRGLWDVIASSMGAREQPLGIAITTAGYNSAGICYEQREYLCKVLNATLLRHGGMGYRVTGQAIEDDTYFGLIYTLDAGYADGRPDDDWADEEVWIKANPNLGVSVSIDELRAQARKAINSPQSRPEFRTKRCNQWLSSHSAWMDMAKWQACGDSELKQESFAGERCWIGLDAAFKTDIFAKVRLFERGGHYYVFGQYWLPETQLSPTENPHLLGWVEDGWIVRSPGPVIDIELVRESLDQDREKHQVVEVPYDPAQLTQFAGEQLEDGFPMVEMRPTVLNFNEPMKKILELVLQGRLHHNGDPVLAWMVSNVVCHMNAKGEIYPRKPEGEELKRKIDGVIALILALGRAIANTSPTMPEDHVPTAA